MTAAQALVGALLAQVLWTLLVMLAAGRARVAAVRAGDVRVSAIALSGEAWPARIRQLSNNMNNQFETPTLFYALVLLALHLGAAGWAMAMLAWGFLASRVLHTLVHTTANDVPRRFQAFVLGVLCLAGMWALLAAHWLGA